MINIKLTLISSLSYKFIFIINPSPFAAQKRLSKLFHPLYLLSLALPLLLTPSHLQPHKLNVIFPTPAFKMIETLLIQSTL